MEGLDSAAGIDRVASLKVLNHKGQGALTPYAKGALRGILAGAVPTQKWRCKVGKAASAVCPYCSTGAVEDEEHMWWECPAWSDIRARHRDAARAGRRPEWTKCFACCGLMPEDPEVVALSLLLPPVDVGSPPPPALVPTNQEMWEDGRVVVYTDGSGENSQDRRFSRAGIGGYWGEGAAGAGHSRNFSAPLTGLVQTNQRAELQAVVRVLDWEDRKLDIRSDSQYTVNGCLRLQQGAVADPGKAHADLWERVEAHLRSRGPDAVRFTKVKGHATEAEATPVDREGNNNADKLACAGSQQHAVPVTVRRAATDREKLASDAHRMFLEILAHRAQRRAPGDEGDDDDDDGDQDDEEDDDGKAREQDSGGGSGPGAPGGGNDGNHRGAAPGGAWARGGARAGRARGGAGSTKEHVPLGLGPAGEARACDGALERRGECGPAEPGSGLDEIRGRRIEGGVSVLILAPVAAGGQRWGRPGGHFRGVSHGL